MRGRNRSGIYCILNRESGFAYVGKASNIASRIDGHFSLLTAGKHHSKKLQADFDKVGRSGFAVNVLQECDATQLDRLEHDWMIRVRPAYNSAIPDYAAVARCAKPDGRLRRRRDVVNQEPSRYICKCGSLKSLSSRGCLNCLRSLAAQMTESGYLPSDHEFELESLRSPGRSAAA